MTTINAIAAIASPPEGSAVEAKLRKACRKERREAFDEASHYPFFDEEGRL